jgi:hypothetical protein
MEGHIMDALEKKFYDLVVERLHQRFLKEYGRKPNSPREQREFYSKHRDGCTKSYRPMAIVFNATLQNTIADGVKKLPGRSR